MKIFTIIPILLLISIFSIHSAIAAEDWKRGEIVLASGETVQGLLNYTEDIVQCNTDDRILAYSTLQVQYFQFFDQKLNTYRTFVPVNNAMAANVKKPAFYELVCEGSITLLRKEEYAYKLASDPYKDRDLAYQTQSLERFQYDVHLRVQDFTYFYLFNGKFNPLNNFRKEVSPIMEAYEPEISHFIEQHSLNPKEIESQIKIVAYYNQLHHEKNVALRK